MPVALLAVAIAILLRKKIKEIIDEATAKANELVEYATEKMKEAAERKITNKKRSIVDKLFSTPIAAKTKILVAACQVCFESNS